MITLKDFLKKYSNISNKFIDDFFSLYDLNTTDDDFIIDIDILADWLNVHKRSLKDTLLDSYEKNIDYKIKKNKTYTGGRHKETILITKDTLKRLCMLSRSKKAESVRTYFIELEKFVDKYKYVIIEHMQKRITDLEENQKPKINTKGGLIYVLKSSDDIEDVYRIGKTKKFKERLNTHNSSHCDNIKVVYVYETDNIDQVEACLKGLLKTTQYRKRKEFYQVEIDVIKELIKSCDELSLKVKNRSKKNTEGGFYYLMLHED